MSDLYPHQQEVINELRHGFHFGHKRQMVGAATAFGKTVVAGHIVKCAVAKGRKVLFLVHMKELVLQAVETFSSMGLSVGIIQADNTDYHSNHDVVVACVASLRNRRAPEWVELVLIDEAHILFKEHIHLMERWNAVPFIGLSATPLRPDLGKYFSNLVVGKSIEWLIKNGYLVPVKAFAPGVDKITSLLSGIRSDGNTFGTADYNKAELGTKLNQPHLIGDIVATWKKHGQGRQTLVFPVNIAHSKAIVEAFEVHGIRAAHVDAHTKDEERRELFTAFNSGDIHILSSAGVLSIGFNSPIASCVILARPTKSLALYIQQVGRGIRTYKGKTDCVVLDHAGNTLEHGLPIHFEIPDLCNDEHKNAGKATKKNKIKMIACSGCGFVLEPAQQICASCGIDRPKPKCNVVTLDGELQEYGSQKSGKKIYTDQDKKNWFQGFKWYGQAHNYKPGYVWQSFASKFDHRAPGHWESLPPIYPDEEQVRWIRSRHIRYSKSRK